MLTLSRLPLPPKVYKRTLRPYRRVKTYVVEKFDPYRDSSLRYMGYANEVGEALEQYLPEWGLPASYTVAISYVLFDTIDKGEKAFAKASKTEKLKEAAITSIDTLTWQLLASVFWPGGVIRCVVNLVELIQEKMEYHQPYLPTVIGILMIPMIVRPIDEAVDSIMEKSISRIIRGEIKDGEKILAVWSAMGSFSFAPVLYSIASVLKKIHN
jgi:fission process protein 1